MEDKELQNDDDYSKELENDDENSNELQKDDECSKESQKDDDCSKELQKDDEYSIELKNLFKARKNLFNMLKARGYEIPDESYEKTIEDLHKTMGDLTDPTDTSIYSFLCGKEINGVKVKDEGICGMFVRDLKVNSDTMHRIISKLNDSECSKAIVVYRGIITPTAFKVRTMILSAIDIQMFRELDLCVDITEHEYVPKHEILSKEEKDALFKKYQISKKQLPKIKSADPVARYYGLKADDVVKITRPSLTGGKYVTYRITI